MYKKGVIFDSAGPLFDDPLMDISWLAERYGIDPGKLNTAKDSVWVQRFSVQPSFGYESFWREVFKEVGYEARKDEIDSANRDILESHKPHEKMLGYSRELKYDPRAVTVLWTNNSRDWYNHLSKAHGLSDIFDFVYPSALLKERKESPGLISQMLWNLTTRGCHRIAVVDDQKSKLNAIARHGVDRLILYEDEERTIEEIKDFLDD